jgi:O-antigen/teichoic acid export membrane protein
MIAGVAMTVLSMTDTLMLGIFSAPKVIGIYNASVRLAGGLTIIIFSVNNILAPRLGNSHAEGNRRLFSRQVRAAVSLCFWPSLLAGGVLLAFPAWFLTLFGNEFGQGISVLRVLVLGALVNALAGPVGWVLCMTGHETVFQRLLLLCAGLNIGLNALLIPRYGALGAAVTTAVCTALWNILAAVFASKYLGVCTIYGCSRFLERRENG